MALPLSSFSGVADQVCGGHCCVMMRVPPQTCLPLLLWLLASFEARTGAFTVHASNLVLSWIYAADCTAMRLGCAAAVFGICTSSTPAL